MKKICIGVFLLIIVGFSCLLFASEDTQKDSLAVKKLDQIDKKIDNISNMQNKMFSETKNQPLLDKKFGIEVNLFRLLWIGNANSFSGTYSVFDTKKNTEIAFPIYYINPKESKELNSFLLDCHYRYFLRNTLNGFYLSVFSRYAHLSGYSGNDNFYLYEQPNKKITKNKLGIGIGVGYRIFSYKGIYWGTSMSYGRYLVGDSDVFYGNFLDYDDDNEQIIDFEFLKFGWAF